MNDDETHVSGGNEGQPSPEHRSGWAPEDQTSSAVPNYDAWHQGSSQPPSGGWNSGGPSGSWPGRNPYSSGAPYARAQSASPAPAPAPKKRSLGWVGPAVVILAGLVAFGLVLFFTQNKDSSPTTNGAPTVATGQGSGQGSSSSSSSSSSQTTDLLPSNGRTSCQVDRTSTSTISASNAVLTGTTMSCEFADMVISNVNSHVQSDPATTSFPLDKQYSNSTQHSYNFSCNRSNHLTTCTAPGDHGTIALAVQDNVQ